jgi:hypothetical protein
MSILGFVPPKTNVGTTALFRSFAHEITAARRKATVVFVDGENPPALRFDRVWLGVAPTVADVAHAQRMRALLLERGHRAEQLPVAGLMISTDSVADEFTHSPLIKFLIIFKYPLSPFSLFL